MKLDQKYFVRVILIALSFTILIGISIMWYFLSLSNDSDSLQLEIRVNGQKTIRFDGLALIPGEEREYEASLRSDIPGDYVLLLDFVEDGENNTLKQFAYARIKIGDEVICDERLSELFDGDLIEISTYLSKKVGCDIKITYYMPAEVGNEAENATADFKIIISSAKERK